MIFQKSGPPIGGLIFRSWDIPVHKFRLDTEKIIGYYSLIAVFINVDSLSITCRLIKGLYHAI